jgi:hypothetical protein
MCTELSTRHVHIGLQTRMEDGDSDAAIMMADYGTDSEFSDDVDPNVTRESGIGSPVSPGFGGISSSRFPIPDWPGIRVGNRQTGRFPIRPGPGIGVGTGGGTPARGRGFPGLALGSAELVLA